MAAEVNTTDSAEVLMSYLERLNNGEPLESIRNDFRERFGAADAGDIVEAEKEMIRRGTPLAKVRKLCDLHSALFHGNTRRERLRQAEAAVMDSRRNQAVPGRVPQNVQSMPSAKSAAVKGHPLNILAQENREFLKRLDRLEDLPGEEGSARELLASLEDLALSGVHYDKKDELILPTLKRHGVQGPADVMWNADGELRRANKALISKLKSAAEASELAIQQDLKEEVQKLSARMREMIFKEDKILYPLAEKNFTEEEWQLVYQDMPRFGYAWITDVPKWDGAAAPERIQTSVVLPDGTAQQAEVKLPGGTLSLPELEGILRTLPVELTFIDAEDNNRYFSEDSSLFPRAMSALGHRVYECHPPKVLPAVHSVISQLKSGEKDVISFIAPKHGRKALVRYMAVRSRGGAYLGTLEVAEDITEFQNGTSSGK